MSKVLSKLLDMPEAEISATVSKLEAICGYPSHDVRLLAENKQKLRLKISQLGLDPDDTTDEELYYAIRTRYQSDSQILDKATGVEPYSDLDERIDKATQLLRHHLPSKQIWAVKKTAAKQAIVSFPPKHVAKAMKYRSIQSLIKRSDIAEIFLAAKLLEPASWHKKISQHLAKLGASNYELRAVKLVKVSPDRWNLADTPKTPVITDDKLGSVAFWPVSELNNASVLTLTLLLLSGLEALQTDLDKKRLHELNPALLWWRDCQHLISEGSPQVSFNLLDVAVNQLNGHKYAAAKNDYGRRSLWHELTTRYHQISVAAVESAKGKAENNPSVSLPMSNDLAAELALVE